MQPTARAGWWGWARPGRGAALFCVALLLCLAAALAAGALGLRGEAFSCQRVQPMTGDGAVVPSPAIVAAEQPAAAAACGSPEGRRGGPAAQNSAAQTAGNPDPGPGVANDGLGQPTNASSAVNSGGGGGMPTPWWWVWKDEPSLPASLLRAAVTDRGDARLLAFASRLMRGDNVTIAVVGGSVSRGSGARSLDEAWCGLLARDVQAAFPQAKVKLHNGAVGVRRKRHIQLRRLSCTTEPSGCVGKTY